MLKNIENLEKSPLFKGIATEALAAVLNCMDVVPKQYLKNQPILSLGDRVKGVGVLAYGKAQVIKEDAMGNRSIITTLKPGDLFAESFVCAGIEESPVSVVALEATEVGFIQMQKIVGTCSNVCGFHQQIIQNLLQIIARKNLNLNKKVDYLSLRSIREKLLAYLGDQYRLVGENPFTIPLNRAQLADYLCIDRSAMSRELGKMRDAEMLSINRNEFFLKEIPDDDI